MRQVELRRTFEEISDHNKRMKNALGIFRIINRVSPRDWVFKLRFEPASIVNLSISTEPRLSLAELELIADGCIPELFNSDALGLGSESTGNFLARIEGDARTNALSYSEETSSTDFGLRIVNFGRGNFPPQFYDPSTVTRRIYADTWFGSHFLSHSYAGKKIRFDVFGKILELTPKGPDQRLPWREEHTCVEYPILVAGKLIASGALVAGSPTDMKGVELHHAMLGKLDLPLPMTLEAVRNLRGKVSLYIEVEEKELNYDSSGLPGPYEKALELCHAVDQSTAEIVHSQKIKDFLVLLETSDRQRQAKRISDRQAALAKRPRVIAGSELLCCVPQSENEVIVLVSKLEGMKAIPFEMFRLLEYTPQEGIDAIGDFQITSTSAPERNAPIEFEYYFENFLRHEHAVMHVKLIVCWAFQNTNTSSMEGLTQQSQYLWRFEAVPYMCWVLLVSRIPGLSISN